ncbi:hypothetical protein DL96DRAFT_1620894 [Flagelloscypha sp. PMI_526]|nr:hypothetical protein DL96DRAFT_1620894 [Flagelloscypha sp. PMI_526]
MCSMHISISTFEAVLYSFLLLRTYAHLTLSTTMRSYILLLATLATTIFAHHCKRETCIQCDPGDHASYGLHGAQYEASTGHLWCHYIAEEGDGYWCGFDGQTGNHVNDDERCVPTIQCEERDSN